MCKRYDALMQDLAPNRDVDTAVMMPYLSRYLGHSSIAETQYYFHTIEQDD